MGWRERLTLAGALALMSFSSAYADEVIVGFAPGGSYDQWGRIVAAHMGNHLPTRPTYIVRNMPSAGSLTAANHIYSSAPKDGSVIAIIARTVPVLPVMGVAEARFDSRKFTWIGSPTTETNVCVANHGAAVQSLQDLAKKELIVGAAGSGDGTYIYPKVLSQILGMKFKIISGYKGSADVFLAMEKQEVQGICESYASLIHKQPTWISSGKIVLLFQGGLAPDPALPQVPFLIDLQSDPEMKQTLRFLYSGLALGRPFIAPPGLKAETVARLRKAFDETMKDPAFLTDAKKQKLDVAPVSGEALAAILQDVYRTPKPIVERISAILPAQP
jgi:tripartite-type tricarboxylate transporter receptor subunit TctC